MYYIYSAFLLFRLDLYSITMAHVGRLLSSKLLRTGPSLARQCCAAQISTKRGFHSTHYKMAHGQYMKGASSAYITADELEAKLGELVVYDIRELFELQATGVIAGSVHIPFSDLLTVMLEEKIQLPDGGKNVVFYCQAGVRSEWACLMAAQHCKANDTVNFKGGMDGWLAAQKSTVKIDDREKVLVREDLY